MTPTAVSYPKRRDDDADQSSQIPKGRLLSPAFRHGWREGRGSVRPEHPLPRLAAKRSDRHGQGGHPRRHRSPGRHDEVAFEDLPDDWKCPRCKQGKDKFTKA
ncbi:MAG: rubredoxin [Oscillospiraceae bacterium]|nr:rubredoxin [Oscillospiraceae bacterium]